MGQLMDSRYNIYAHLIEELTQDSLRCFDEYLEGAPNVWEYHMFNELIGIITSQCEITKNIKDKNESDWVKRILYKIGVIGYTREKKDFISQAMPVSRYQLSFSYFGGRTDPPKLADFVVFSPVYSDDEKINMFSVSGIKPITPHGELVINGPSERGITSSNKDYLNKLRKHLRNH